MIILDTTGKSLEVVLAGSVTSNQLPFTAAYADVTSSGTTLIESDGQTNNVTAVTLVSAPASSTVRVVKQITLQNADTAAATATIRLNNSSTLRTLFLATLAAGDQILYGDAGFQVFASTGALKTAAANPLPDPVTVAHGGTGLSTLTAHGLLVGEGTSNVALVGPGSANTLLHGAGASADPSFSAVVEGDLSLSDVTTVNASITKHGFLPKLPNSSSQFLDGTGTWGATVPLLAGGNTFSGANVFSGDIYTVAWTDYAPSSTIVGWSSFNYKHIAYGRLGKRIWVIFRLDGISNSTAASFTLPYAAESTVFPVGANIGNLLITAYDNGAYVATVGKVVVSPGSNTANCFSSLASAAWTASGTKIVEGQFFYEVV